MNLGEIRQLVLDQDDWRPTSSADFTALVNRMVNRAYRVLGDQAPFLLEGHARLVTQADAANSATVATDRMSVVAADRWVLEKPAGVGTAWSLDGTWDGRWIEVTDAGGQVHRRQTREWWTDLGAVRDRVSLVTPWPNATDVNMTYRVYTPEYYLPGDVVEIRSAKMYGDPQHNLEVVNQYDAEDAQLVDYRGQYTGYPQYIFLGPHFQLMAPTRAATVVAAGMPAWAGPDNAGEFDYVYTYVWGEKDIDIATPHALSEPQWESAPSPASARITTTNGTTLIRVTMPDVDFELNFNRAGSTRAARSGLRKRVYGRRYSSAVDGAITRIIESPQVFMLLDEVAGDATTYDHDGSALLDYQRRLNAIHGYRSVRLSPMPDARYEFDCRCLFRPNALVNDQDTPHLAEDAMDTFVQKTLSFFYEYDGKPDMAQFAEARYRDMLQTLTKRYASLGFGITHKQPARVIGGTDTPRAKQARWLGIT